MTDLRGIALRLHGPLQAWGGPAIGDDRPTLPFPTRSAVLGLLAACLGIRRGETAALFDLARGTRVHTRVDSPGTPLVDDQTIQDHKFASQTRQTIQSKRTYLCDASFVVVVVPGPSITGAHLRDAVSTPAFSPFLGRRTCVPSSPILLAADVSGTDPIALFSTLPRGPAPLVKHLRERQQLGNEIDYYLDVADHPRRLRRLPMRDDLAGPLPRQFRERMVVHVREKADDAAETSAIDSWMTGPLS